jgi:hypothetical protein
VKLSVYIVPFLIILGGVITFLLVPFDPTVRALILGADIFAAAAVGLLLWRQSQR